MLYRPKHHGYHQFGLLALIAHCDEFSTVKIFHLLCIRNNSFMVSVWQYSGVYTGTRQLDEVTGKYYMRSCFTISHPQSHKLPLHEREWGKCCHHSETRKARLKYSQRILVNLIPLLCREGIGEVHGHMNNTHINCRCSPLPVRIPFTADGGYGGNRSRRNRDEGRRSV